MRTYRFACLCVVFIASLTASARGGVLLDYGSDTAALNDAGVIRAEGGDGGPFGMTHFQLFSVRAPAWRLDALAVEIRLLNTISPGDASLVIYAASDAGLEPDLSTPALATVGFEVTSQAGQRVELDMGGLELGSGVYYAGIEAAGDGVELLWFAGETDAFRTAARSDGRFVTGSPRALSLRITGEVVPAPGAAVVLVGGVAIVTRRRRG